MGFNSPLSSSLSPVIPNLANRSVVLTSCSLVTMVLIPTPIVSALSRVVARIAVKTPINSLNLVRPSLLPPARENIPPAFLIPSTKS